MILMEMKYRAMSKRLFSDNILFILNVFMKIINLKIKKN